MEKTEGAYKKSDALTAAAAILGARKIAERTVLPLPPPMGDDTRFEMEVYVRFMRHLRDAPSSCFEIRILSAVHFVADVMDVTDAMIAKTLVDLGLRAPRRAFPAGFLDFADRACQRSAWDPGARPASVQALREHWDDIGEDRFGSSVREHYALFNQRLFS